MKRGRGRPLGSPIRQNIVEILYFKGKSYGYDIFRIYREIFPKITIRSVYYHLRKGCELDIFKLEKIKAEPGDYSWGDMAEKIYYSLGPNAKPRGDKRVRDHVKKAA